MPQVLVECFATSLHHCYNNKMSGIKKIVVALFFLVSLLACSWALFHPGMFRIHDFTHAARIAELLRALQDGHFPVRWTSNFGFGYGMPLFEFYAPLPFYVGALFYWLGVGLVPTVKLLFVLCSLLTFIGTYKLGARLFGRAGGLLAAVAVTLAPYRAVNLFVRGALGEAWAMMAIPWVLLGIVRVIRGEKNAWLTLTLGLLALFLSHNITTLLFFPLSLLFAFGYWWIERRRKQMALQHQHKQKVEDRRVMRSPLDWLNTFPLNLGLIYLLVIGLAAFYLFPAFLEKDFTKVNGIFQGYFSYSNHFLYIRQFVTPFWGYGGSQPGPEDGLSFFLGFGEIIGALVTFFLLGKSLIHKKAKNIFSWQVLLAGLFVLETAIALFMTLGKSQFIWDQFPLMVAVQFPWRWLSLAATFLALLMGAATLFIPARKNRYAYVAILLLFLIATNLRYFQPENFDDVSQSFYYSDPKRIRHDMSRTLNDYIPVQMKLDELSKELPPIDVPFVVDQGDATKVTLLANHDQEKLLQTEFSRPGKVEFAVADFPGWTVLIDNVIVPTQRTELGNIVTEVPAGSHQVAVQFRPTPIRAWSDAISAFSLIVFFVILTWSEKNKTEKVAL